MNTKTLLAFSCLLAAAQARPAAPSSSSSCSLTCSGRNFWTGYKAGTTLQYAFDQKVELSSGISPQKSLLTQVAGKASVEVHGDCEMVLTVDVQSAKTSKSPTEATTMDAKTLPKAMVDALKEPLRFSFEDGRIQSMCPSSSETRASLNFKRGLLSQLHLSIDSPDQEVNVREDDVLGNCWTVYKKLGSNKVQKTKDLSSCTSNFEVFPRQGVKFEASQTDSEWPTVVQGNLVCTIELHVDGLVIKESTCEENRVLGSNLGDESQGEKVQVRTSLRLLQKMPTVASALLEVTDRSDLNHRHKTGDKCHDSKAWFEEDIFHSANECLEKKLPASGTASGDFKALAKKTIEELCEETKSNSMLNSTAAKYADLVKYMRGITSQEDFSGLFDWVKGGYCSDNSMLKAIVSSAVPSVGTRQSVQVILNQLKGSEGMSTDSNTANWLVSGIAMMPHPTPDIISDVLEYARKSKEDSMVIIAKEPVLALSAVTGRYCSINTNCESNAAVADVLKFLSDSLGTNCSSLESQDDPAAFDYAFAALLSIGNIGRATGGSSALIGCAENSKLSLAHRAFALRSLRRFPDLSISEKLRLGRLIGSKELDSELRITAYQVVVRFANTSFWNDERVITKLSDLMQDEREDQQVQHYIYTHLKLWLGKQRRMTDSYTVSNILRDYERVLVNLNLNPMQTSMYWTRQIKSTQTKSKIELESNLIYSSKSIMPRFVNFNLTVESPLSGEAINMFEIGLRMEGMEGMLEQVFNMLNKDNSREDELVRKRRQASPELRDEQKQYKQTPMKQRLDIFTRKNGMELMHNNFDDTILGVVPQFMKTLDFENVQGLVAEKVSSFKFDTAGQTAGTVTESSISVPTIAGFPILLKKELHYLTNIGFKQSLDAAAMKFELDVQPTASIYMARTVMVDSGFERAGVKSTTSGLTSTGMKVSLEGKLDSFRDMSFSFKLDSLKKQQKILELKTDVVFVQHSGPNTVVESPVVSPSDMAPVTMRCFTPATVKLFGRRMCLESSFERTYNPMEFVRQNPGSLRFYVDKDDSFGVYEVTLKFKTDGKNCDVQAVLGDQKSPDRHAKFQFSVNRSPESRKIVVELANPVLPIKWVSERKAKGDGADLTVDLKFGSTDYAFRGATSKDSTGEWKLDGNFYRKDKERQQIGIVTRFASYGLLKYLPLFKFDVTATMPSGDKLTFNHLVKYESDKLDLSCLGSHEKGGSVVTSMKSRLQFSRMQRGAAGQTRALLYDMEVTNKNGKNLLHSFSAKFHRTKKDAADAWESTLAVNHKFKYGVTKENTVIDMSANLKLDETIKPGQLYRATGSGDLNYGTESGSKSVKLSNLRIVLGEDDVIDDHFNTKTLLFEYATESDGSKSEALVAVQVLPIKMWRPDNQCLYLTLKASKQVGSDKQAHAFELRHTAGLDGKMPTFLQVAKIVYANEVLFDVRHKFYPISTAVNAKVVEYAIGHHLNVTTYDAQMYFINTQYTIKMSRDITVKASTTVDVNQDRRIQVDQSIHRNDELNRVEYTLSWQRKTTTSSVRLYTQDSSERQRQQSAMEIANYLRRIRSDGFSMARFLPLIRQFIYTLKMESGFEMTDPSMSMQVTNYLDMTVTKGVMLNFTRRANYGGNLMRRSIQIVKELDQSAQRYRRLYKTTIERDSVVSLLVSEVILTKSDNPQLQVSLSKVSISGPQAPDFNVTAIGQFTQRFQRDSQVAIHINVTCQHSDLEMKSKLRIVVDTAPWNVLNPALNLSLAVSASDGKSLNVNYDLGVHKKEIIRRFDIRNFRTISSELSLTSTFDGIGFRSYKEVLMFTSSPEEVFNLLCKVALNEAAIINAQAMLNSKMLYLGVKSDVLPGKEISYKAEWSKDASDKLTSYKSEIKILVPGVDVSITDEGTIKISGGNSKFTVEYSGTLQVKGLKELLDRADLIDKVEYSGKLEADSVGDVSSPIKITNIKGVKSVNVTFSPTSSKKGRSYRTTVTVSVKRDTVKGNYTITSKESYTADGDESYEIESLFMGREGRFPSTLRVSTSGYTVSEFSYNFNPEYNSESYLRWSVSKFGENRNSYLIDYRTKDVSNHVGKFWRDFSLEISSPRRQIYLSESCKMLENGTVQTELQAFVNKRNSEGILAVFNKDFTKTNVYKRSMQLTLPTRQVGYERVLKIDGNKLGYDITIFWDMHSALEKKVAIQFNRERERTPSGYYYYHRLDMAAPFLKNKISKEVVCERKENEFKFSLTHTQESDDKVTFLVSGRRTWDSWRSSYQKEINISFAQQKGDVKANVRITIEASNMKLPGSRYSSATRYMKEVNVFATVPSLSVNSHVRIRHVPFEEFSFACNHGATFSLRRYTGFQRSRLFLFVSNSKKEAGQLTMVFDGLMSYWEATLDTGKGYMDPKSTLSFPIYEPTKVLLKASAGASAKGKKLHFGVVNGPMDVKSSIKLWKPETVPAGLDFFFVGIKLNADNTMGYASHWRIRRSTMKSPFTQLKEVLVDPWAKSENLPVSTDTINKLMKPVSQSKADNIDTDAVLDLLTSISSNDIDALRRWADKARENNEFLSTTIGNCIATAFNVFRSGAGTWAAYVKSMASRDALPSTAGILSGISRLFDATTNALNSIPVTNVWSQVLNALRFTSDQVSTYFSAYIDMLDSAIRDRVRTMTGGRGSSVLGMLYNAVSSVYPVEKAFERISTIAEQYIVCLWTAHVELATQAGNALQPFFISTLAEIPKVYDFFDNLFYEISQWSEYFQSLIQAAIRDNVAKVEKVAGVREWLTPYRKNVVASIGHLLAGQYSRAVRTFFNTDANQVNEWRVDCNQACLDSGSFAAINGTLYIPIELSQFSFTLRSDRFRNAGDALRRFRYNRKSFRRQDLNDALEELKSESGIGGLIRRLLSPEHRTAEAAGNFIRTFGGKELSNLSPCRYLLAHDFLSADFSVYQTYTWDGRTRIRSDLLVRFFDVKATITKANELKLNDAAVTLPLDRKIGEKSVVATKDRDSIKVKFSGELQNTLQVKCKLGSNSCTIRVHPLYHGRLNGAFGSNDGNPANDLHAGSDSDHMRLWVADSCIMS